MKKLNKLVLALAAVCLAAPLAIFAGSIYDRAESSSGGWYGNTGPQYIYGEVTAPAGAEIDWEAYVYTWGSASGYANLSGWGILNFSASASNGGESSSGYAFFPEGGGTVSYYLYADSYSYGGYYSGDYAYSSAMVVGGW